MFGRVVGGLDVIDKLERVETDKNDKPRVNKFLPFHLFYFYDLVPTIHDFSTNFLPNQIAQMMIMKICIHFLHVTELCKIMKFSNVSYRFILGGVKSDRSPGVCQSI